MYYNSYKKYPTLDGMGLNTQISMPSKLALSLESFDVLLSYDSLFLNIVKG